MSATATRSLLCIPLAKARYRAVDHAPDDECWKVLHRLADAAYLALLDDMLAVLEAVRPAIPREALTQRVLSGDQADTEQLLTQVWDEVGQQGLEGTLVPRLRTLALDAAEATPLPEAGSTFDAQDLVLLLALDAFLSTQVATISATTRTAIPALVQRALAPTLPLPGTSAPLPPALSLPQRIDELTQVVGLTPRQAASVQRFRQGLEQGGETPARIQALVERRATAMRRQRAETISRTESITSVHVGQQQRFEQAAREGTLDTVRFRRFWIVTPDDRLCPNCSSIPGLNLAGRALGEPFATPYGPLLHPAAHALCRCSVAGRSV